MMLIPRRATWGRVVVIAAALLVVLLHASFRGSSSSRQSPVETISGRTVDSRVHTTRQLFSISSPPLSSVSDGSDPGNGNDDVDNSNCSHPLSKNDSCTFVYEFCSDDVQLVNYLGFVACSLPHVKPLAYILLALWLLYLISLLATTADYFFVPPLTLLADKLKLSPSIAGITLLAIGNGAPDVFTAYSALQHDDLALLLGALIGASIFISTIVLGSVLLIAKIDRTTIDRIDFMRDIFAYIIVVAAVVGVAFDGDVEIYEAAIFPTLYILYIAAVVFISYMRKWWNKRRTRKFSTPYINPGKENSVDSNDAPPDSGIGSEARDETAPLLDGINVKESAGKKRLELAGLTLPQGRNVFTWAQWAVELPFSLLRWMTVPPCNHDDQWSIFHTVFTVIFPIPALLFALLTFGQTDGFSATFGDSPFPVYAFLIMIGFIASVGLAVYFCLSVYFFKRHSPHWTLQSVLGLMGFIMSIVWLNLEANELVSVLEAFGLAFDIDSAILGLTVLAIGNSVGDWVADTAVARAGQPGMGVASCFGSPLLNDVLGLSVALIVKIGIYNKGAPYIFNIHKQVYSKVKLSWIFLGISLAMSLLVFPLFKFAPPKAFGVVLFYVYFVFMLFSILDVTGVMPINL